MKPAPHVIPRPFATAPHGELRAMGGEEGAPGSEFSLAWKGWTNSGGDRASTAAQFSRLTELNTATPGLPSSASALAGGRAAATAPAVSAPPVYPTHESALLAPVHAAIERLLARGQDQLAVTVRFEQGGSLSLKLTLRDGGIAAHLKTDVPGLEEALRSSWSSFAQDWNQRGIKLAAPTFGGAMTNADAHAGRDGQRAPEQDGEARAGEKLFFAPSPGRRLTGAAGRAAADIAELADSRVLHSTPRSGLSTWA